jgi:hypothetical protein
VTGASSPPRDYLENRPSLEKNVLTMNRRLVGPQCDRADVVVSGEEDVGVGVEMVAEACG